MKKRIALFAGSFDPFTLGHYDIVKRALPLFDEIVIGIGLNQNKRYMFVLEKRMQFIEDLFKNDSKVKVTSYDGLTVDYCTKIGAKFMLRGLRNPADFEYEKAITHTNRTLNKKIEMVFLLTSSGKSFISSSILREVLKHGGDYTKFVPKGMIIKPEDWIN